MKQGQYVIIISLFNNILKQHIYSSIDKTNRKRNCVYVCEEIVENEHGTFI